MMFEFELGTNQAETFLDYLDRLPWEMVRDKVLSDVEANDAANALSKIQAALRTDTMRKTG